MSSMDFFGKLLDGVTVEWKTLGEVTSIKTGQSVNKQMISASPGEYPVINSGREPLGFIDKWNTDNDPIGITSRGAGVGSVTWQPGKYFRGNLNYSVTIKNIQLVSTRYLYHLLLEMQPEIQSLCTYDGIPALNAGNLKELQVPIPCPDNPKKSLEIQAEIARILDAFTELTAGLTAELTARKKQYDYYRDQLLRFDDGDVDWKMLGEVAKYSKTRISFERLEKTNYVGVDNLLKNRVGKSESNYVPTSGNFTEYREGDILIGNIRPYLRKIWQADRAGGTNGDVLVIHPNDTVNARYLFQVLADEKFFEWNMQHAKGAKMPRGNKDKIMEYRFQVPKNPTEQARIAFILDKFETLTNSLADGLPREIALRQKQYAHYRDLLFDFPKPETALAASE